MGANLARGCVVGERLQCPFHQWEFDPDGTCKSIPADVPIPAFARQRSYPTIERGGFVFFANDAAPPMTLPFFEGITPEQLRPARPFEFIVNMPWYLVAANGFDLQHFRSAHDRTLVAEPSVSQVDEHTREITARFEVTGISHWDRITRLVSGPYVTMTIRSIAGVMVLVKAEFRRTTSYGMVCVTPLAEHRTRVRNIVWVPRRKNAIARTLIDPIDCWVRRAFIRNFVYSDVERSAGIRFTPGAMIEPDRVLCEYVAWVMSLRTVPQ